MLSTSSPQIVLFTDLTNIFFLDAFIDKNHTALRLSFINAPGLNKLLRSEIFISKGEQLLVAYLILEYEPISCIYQDASQAIRVGDSKLARIDVSKLGFLAQRDLPPFELPLQRVPPQVAALKEESASSHHTFDAKIDQFRFEEVEGVPEKPVELIDSKHESNKFSAAYSPKLIVAQIDTNSKVKEEGMDLKPRIGLKGLLANRNKGLTSKEIPKTQVLFKHL